MGTKPVTPDQIPAFREAVIDERGGPIDKINEALREPWARIEMQAGRHVEAHLGGANKNQVVTEAVLKHYREAGWHVRHETGDAGIPARYLFRRPKETV